MYLNAEILSIEREKRLFKKSASNGNGKGREVEVVKLQVRCLEYQKIFDLLIYNKDDQQRAGQELKKGMEAVFSFPTLHGIEGGRYNQYATPTRWKVTKDLNQKIKELQAQIGA